MSQFAGKSSDQTLKRIQEETQRVRRRLIEDDLGSNNMVSPSKHATPEKVPSIELSPSGTPFEQAGTPSSDYVIENSDSHTFKDPVPARNQSVHLKHEHEAFKQR